MVLNGTPTIHYEGRVVGGGPGYSSLLADLARGHIFSAQVSPAQVLRPGPAPTVPHPAPAAADAAGPAGGSVPAPPPAPALALALPTPAPVERPIARAELSAALCPPGALTAPGGLAAGALGSLSLLLPDRGSACLRLQVQGLRPVAPAQAQYAIWLLHDLHVPLDLPPEDLALLPRGPLGTGNAPGGCFTLDGQAPVQGPAANTVTVAVQAGMFTPGGDTLWEGSFDWGEAAGWTMNPAAALGAAAAHLGPGIFLPVPSGVARAILADVFLRRASRFVHLPLHSAFPQRLLAATQEALPAWDADGSGSITSADLAAIGRGDAFLGPLEFGRVVVTLEPVAGRITPLLLPTAPACALAGALVSG